MDTFITFLTKLILVFAAAFVPFVLGDKLAKAVSNTAKKARGMATKNLWKKSAPGAWLAARGKIREDEALKTAQSRIAKPGRVGQWWQDTRLGKKLGFSPETRDVIGNKLILDYAKANEGVDKNAITGRLRDKYAEEVINHKGEKEWRFKENMEEAFKRDHEAQGMVLAKFKEGLLDDNVDPKDRFMNDLVGIKIDQGDGHFISTAQSAGSGYFLNPYARRKRNPDGTSNAIKQGAIVPRKDAKGLSGLDSTSIEKVAVFYDEAIHRGRPEDITDANTIVQSYATYLKPGAIRDLFTNAAHGSANSEKAIKNLSNLMPEIDASGTHHFKSNFARSVYSTREGRAAIEELRKEIEKRKTPTP